MKTLPVVVGLLLATLATPAYAGSPAIHLTSPKAGASASGTVHIRWTLDDGSDPDVHVIVDNAEVDYYYSGSFDQNHSYWDSDHEPGRHTVKVVTDESYGPPNSDSVTFVVPAPAPSLALTSDGTSHTKDYALYADAATANTAASDDSLATLTICLDGSRSCVSRNQPDDHTQLASSELPAGARTPGDHTFTATVVDTYGARASSTLRLRVVADPPPEQTAAQAPSDLQPTAAGDPVPAEAAPDRPTQVAMPDAGVAPPEQLPSVDPAPVPSSGAALPQDAVPPSASAVADPPQPPDAQAAPWAKTVGHEKAGASLRRLADRLRTRLLAATSQLRPAAWTAGLGALVLALLLLTRALRPRRFARRPAVRGRRRTVPRPRVVASLPLSAPIRRPAPRLTAATAILTGERRGEYELLDYELGRGSFGSVRLATDRQRRLFAVKSWHSTDPEQRRILEREVTALRRCDSPYLARFVDADLGAAPPYLVMEWVDGRRLSELLAECSGLNDRAFDVVAIGLASALHAMHQVGVQHNDVKPDNVMLRAGTPVLVDFGGAVFSDEPASQVLITHGFAAPERLLGQRGSFASDIWSWGAVLSACAPSAGIPAKWRDLVTRALSHDPARRPSAAELLCSSTAIYDGDALLRDHTLVATAAVLPPTALLTRALDDDLNATTVVGLHG